MKRVLQVLSPSPAQALALLRWALVLFVLPLALFVAVVMLQGQPRPDVTRIQSVDLWLEPLGRVPFDAAYLAPMVQTAPDFAKAQWQKIALPNSIELGASIDLPANAPKARAWFRVQVPPELTGANRAHGRLGLMGNRVMGGGPWTVWVDGHLLQANLVDWRIQWNTPLRAMLPLDVTEVLVAVPYAQVQGYAMGSMFIGPADAIDIAWQARNFWQADAPRAASIVALLMMVMSLQLAVGRRNEPAYALLSANALVWALVNLQYFYDFTGQDRLSQWFGAAMDVFINWEVALILLFAFELEQIKVPRLRAALVLYACASTLITLPLWHWDENALLAQHFVNVGVYIVGASVFAWHVFRAPSREGVAVLLALAAQLVLGLHALLFLTNQTHPDHVFTFPFGVVALFMVFMYVINRRTVLALNTSEHHQAELEAQLLEQKQRLAKQHERMHRLEIENQLAAQHDTLMQDLHDGLGSNLTSALLQARGGKLKQDDTLLLLQDLTDELRNLSRTTSPAQRSLNELLAELRQRVQPRLSHGGIRLVWAVDPVLPAICRTGPAADQHLRALLSEAMANVIKHAQATQVRVSAEVRGETVVIEVTDNGKGFKLDQTEVGRGLPGMRQRAQMLGAVLSINPDSGQGCRWWLELPIVKPALNAG
jgi:signal transduction histidine kinase